MLFLDILLALVLMLYILHNFYSVLSADTIITRSGAKVWNGQLEFDGVYEKLGIIVPLYHENSGEIAKTFNSISAQDYPKELFYVRVVVEEGDTDTIEAVEDNLCSLSASGVRCELVVKPAPRTCKASALNFALKRAKEDIVAVYDGGDVFDAHQFKAALSLLQKGYSAVGVRVLRGGESLLSHFSLVETMLWYNVALPSVFRLTGYPLLSGEGMFIRREFLEATAGFKEVLTEDSYLTLMMAHFGKRAALLDSSIFEAAPNGWKSLIRQRTRWYRGYTQCAKDLLRMRMAPKTRVLLFFVFLSPLCLLAVTLSMTVTLIGILVFFGLEIVVVPGFLWWSYVTSIITVVSALYVYQNDHDNRRIAILMPLYWMFMGLVSLYATLTPRVSWYKTMRS